YPSLRFHPASACEHPPISAGWPRVGESMSARQWLILAVVYTCVAACMPSLGFNSAPTSTLRIVSGSENETLEPLVKQFGQQNGVNIEVSYKGSLDIMLLLENGSSEYDAIWPANSLWISLGDKNRIVKDSESIMRSPVVLGVKRSVAQKLGWIGKD